MQDENILVVKALVDTNKQVNDELNQDCDEINKKLNKHDFEFSEIKALLNMVLVYNQTSLPDNIIQPK